MHLVSLENNIFIYHTDQPANAARKTVTRCCENPTINKILYGKNVVSLMLIKVVRIVTTGLYRVSDQKHNYFIVQVRI
jgi:hypothetical protein